MHPFAPPLRFRPVAILRHPLYSLSPRVLNSPLSLSRCSPLSIVVIIVIIPAKRRPVVERSFPPLDSRESGRNLSRARIPNGRGREEKKEKYEITVRDLISSRYLHGSARYFRPVGGWNAWRKGRVVEKIAFQVRILSSSPFLRHLSRCTRPTLHQELSFDVFGCVFFLFFPKSPLLNYMVWRERGGGRSPVLSPFVETWELYASRLCSNCVA